MFYCYVLKCKDGSLYCGSTNDLQKRSRQHNSGKGSAYVRSRGGGKIVYFEKFRKWGSALKREAAIKKWPRAKKMALVKG